jgi:transposase
MLADQLDYVIGVDTHRDRHALAVVACASGAGVFEASVAGCAGGYAEALALAERWAPARRAFAIEGTGSYGKGLARFLQERGELVFEIDRPRRRGRSGRIKSDPLDALRAARVLLAEERPAHPRAAGEREVLRALLLSRRSAVQARKVALNQLRALLVTCPEPLRAELRSLSRARLLARLEQASSAAGDELAGTLLVLQLLGRRIAALALEERSLTRELLERTSRIAPQLLAERGIGPISAAQTLVSWSHPGRLRGEAAFARLAGAAPIPASSGRTVRHRLDRGGDRQLNHSLHQIVLSRRRHHPPTAAYIARRISEGKSEREAVRPLKRYLARHLYRVLEQGVAMT